MINRTTKWTKLKLKLHKLKASFGNGLIRICKSRKLVYSHHCALLNGSWATRMIPYWAGIASIYSLRPQLKIWISYGILWCTCWVDHKAQEGGALMLKICIWKWLYRYMYQLRRIDHGWSECIGGRTLDSDCTNTHIISHLIALILSIIKSWVTFMIRRYHSLQNARHRSNYKK